MQQTAYNHTYTLQSVYDSWAKRACIQNCCNLNLCIGDIGIDTVDVRHIYLVLQQEAEVFTYSKVSENVRSCGIGNKKHNHSPHDI